MIAIAFAFGYAGFLALSLSLSRHAREALARPLPARAEPALRALGTVLLAAVLALCVGHAGAGIGLVLWCAVLTVAALTVALLHSYAPRRTPLVAALLLPLALLAGWLGG